MIVKEFQYCAKIFCNILPIYMININVINSLQIIYRNNKTAFNFSIKCGLQIANYSACQALMPLCTFSVVA